MKAIEKLGTIVPSKTSQSSVVASMIEAVVTGDTNPIEAEVFVSFLENICKEYRKNEIVRGLVTDTLEECGGKIDTSSAKVSLIKSKSYDYCVSAKWRELDSEAERIKELKKCVEEALKNASGITPFVDPLNGEMFTTPPIDEKKGDKLSVRITLNKEA